MAVLKTYPLILNLRDHIPVELGDPLLNAWILAWDVHALTSDPARLFNANIFYPAPQSLAFSEHMLGVVPLFAPVYALTGNPILAYNIIFFLSFPLCGIAMFLLVEYWTRSFWASLLAGSLFAFAPTRLLQVGHLQLLNFYWAPLALIFLEKFLRSQRWRHLAGFAICYWWQVLCSVYLGWFITILVSLYAGYRVLVVDKRLLTRSLLTKGLIIGALSGLVLLPLHLPYYAVQQAWGFSRSLAECISFSADLALSYVNPFPFMNDLYLNVFQFATRLSSPGENQLFPGLVLPGLMLLAGAFTWNVSGPATLTTLRRHCWVMLIASLVLSLGPHLIILGRDTQIPLPYLALYYLAPGFRAMRVPTRFVLMGGVAASVLAALGFLRVWAELQTRLTLRGSAAGIVQACLALVILSLFLLELGFKPLPLARIQTGQEVPEVYRWLAANKVGPIAELPLGMVENFVSMYFSTYHWQPLVNGWSGFVPPVYFQLAHEAQFLPSRQATAALSAAGVRALVVHTDRLPPTDALRWRQANLGESGLQQAAVFGADVVYKLPTVASTQRLALEFSAPDRLPTGADVRLTVLATGDGRQAWRQPPPLGRTAAQLEWKPMPSGTPIVQRHKLELPVAMRAGEFSAIALPVHTPSTPGPYTLSVVIPALGVTIPPSVVTMTSDPLPTSLNSPSLLAAAYTLDASDDQTDVGMPMRLALRATNTGSAVWLADAAGDKGAVRLGWSWYKGDEVMPGKSGRQLLPFDIFPGQSYGFHATIDPPDEPGDYRLELELVSELVTWFSAQGIEPLKITVRVRRTQDGETLPGR